MELQHHVREQNTINPSLIKIARELDLLGPIRVRADILIDTTDMSPHDLRADLERWFAPGGAGHLAVTVRRLPASVA